VKQLPPRPNLEHLKKQAKAILKEGKAATLAEAQRHVAEIYGFNNWPAFRRHVLAHDGVSQADRAIRLLREAASAGDATQVAAILDADPEIIDERSGPGMRAALHFAVIANSAPVVRLLLQRGADPNVRCEGDSATPLHFAAEKGNTAIVQLLLDHGADATGLGDCHELEVIGWAACFGSPRQEVVDLLLARGAVHNIFSAVALGALDAIRQLIAKDRQQLERRMSLANRRRCPLHLAVVNERVDSLRTLLDLGANCDSLDEAGCTPLDTAAMQGSQSIVDRLIAHGATIRLPAAVALGHTETLARLLRRDPDCLRPGNQWGTLIVRAAEKASGEIVAMLLQMGASPNVRDNPLTAVDAVAGYTPLHAAAFHGNLPAVEVLLRCGANVRARDERYLGTPAGWAAFAGHKVVSNCILQEAIDPFEAIEMGLAHRLPAILSADPEALHRRLEEYLGFTASPAPSFHPGVGREPLLTPLQFAEAIGDTEAVRILRNWGTNQPSGA